MMMILCKHLLKPRRELLLGLLLLLRLVTSVTSVRLIDCKIPPACSCSKSGFGF
jgi:hypothetical protein